MPRQKPILSHLDADGLSHLLGSVVEALRQRGEGALALRRLAEEHEELSLALAHGTPAGDSSTSPIHAHRLPALRVVDNLTPRGAARQPGERRPALRVVDKPTAA